MDTFNDDKTIADTTKENYKKYFKLIETKCGLNENDFEKRNGKEILLIIKAQFNVESGYYKNIVTAISKYLNLKNIPRETYTNELKILKEVYIKNREKNEKNEKETKNWIDYEELKIYCLKLLDENLNQDAMIIASYVLIPPIRNDWNSIKIKKYNKDKDNFIKDDILTLNKYKTSKTYGKIEFPLPKLYLKYFHVFLKSLKENQEYLFVDRKMNYYQKNNFSKRIIRIFKRKYPDKNLNIQLLRKIFSSQEQKESLENIRFVSKVMGHSVMEHLRYFKMKT